jgi:hypothetical protein
MQRLGILAEEYFRKKFTISSSQTLDKDQTNDNTFEIKKLKKIFSSSKSSKNCTSLNFHLFTFTLIKTIMQNLVDVGI